MPGLFHMISSTTSRSCGDRLSSTSRSVCVVGLAELRPLLVDNIDAGLNLLDVLDEGLGDVLTIGVIRCDGRDAPAKPTLSGFL
jgi:hypothetical protein